MIPAPGMSDLAGTKVEDVPSTAEDVRPPMLVRCRMCWYQLEVVRLVCVEGCLIASHAKPGWGLATMPMPFRTGA